MPASRRDVIRALGAGAAALPGLGAGSAVAEETTSHTDALGPGAVDPAKAAFLASFEPAWDNLDPQLHAVLKAIYGQLYGSPPPTQLTPEEFRRINASLIFYATAGAPPLPHIEERRIAVSSGEVRVRLYDPGVAAPAPTVVYIHGGGWVYGSIDTYDGVTRQLAKRSGMRVLSIEYALAPEHPFPAPLDDCLAAVDWAVREGSAFGIDPKRIALCGDSAGGNLALAASLALRDRGGGPVRGAALLYGVYSLDLDTGSKKAFGGGPYFLGTAETGRYWDLYLPTAADRANPLAVPILADLSGLPSLYVATCEFDPLLDDSKALAARARAAAVDVELRTWPKMVHGSASLMGWIDAMSPEMDRVAAFLRRVTRADG